MMMKEELKSSWKIFFIKNQKIFFSSASKTVDLDFLLFIFAKNILNNSEKKFYLLFLSRSNRDLTCD